MPSLAGHPLDCQALPRHSAGFLRLFPNRADSRTSLPEAKPAAGPVPADCGPIVTPAAGAPLFRLQGVSRTYATPQGPLQALQDVHLDIGEGEIFGIIGRSGAGKSTLLRTLNLLERPDGGQVTFDGQNLLALSPAQLRQARQRMGMVFQHFNLLSSRTVFDNVALPLELAGLRPGAIRSRVGELLELVGLTALGERYPAQISGGQKQRVGIARALASHPRVLLCDEATSALDPETTLSILELLADINRRLNLTIVLITHQMPVIKAVAHKVAVMEGGLIVEQGNVADIFTAPRQEITRTLLREVVGDTRPPGLGQRLERLLAGRPGALWRLTLRGPAVDQPLLADLAARFALQVHVVHGYIDEVQGLPFATLLAVAAGDRPVLASAGLYLRRQGVVVDLLEDLG